MAVFDFKVNLLLVNAELHAVTAGSMNKRPSRAVLAAAVPTHAAICT